MRSDALRPIHLRVGSPGGRVGGPVCGADNVLVFRDPRPRTIVHVPSTTCPRCLVVVDALVETGRWALVREGGLVRFEGDRRMLTVPSHHNNVPSHSSRIRNFKAWLSWQSGTFFGVDRKADPVRLAGSDVLFLPFGRALLAVARGK